MFRFISIQNIFLVLGDLTIRKIDARRRRLRYIALIILRFDLLQLLEKLELF